MDQGKGFGACSIENEIDSLSFFLTKEPRLGVDIGGNIGNYSAFLRHSFPLLEIFIFEPSQTNTTKLSQRFKTDPLIHIIDSAVSNTSDTARLFSDKPGSGLSSLTQRRLDHFGTSFDTIELVKTIRFEDFWVNNLSSRFVDFVKLDIEGHELQALQGFGKAINSIGVIQFEFGGCNIDTRTFFQDFWYFFNPLFVLYRITPFGPQLINDYRESDEYFCTTNFLAVRR